MRRVVAWTSGIIGLLAYNWWILVPLRPGIMVSPNELFSDLEVTGQPFARAMQHADLLSGLLLCVAFLAAGRTSIPDGRREWSAMMVFSLAGAFGGLFPEICSDGVNAICRNRELRFQLPVQQYMHIAAGILEFGAITLALFYAWRRTRNEETLNSRIYKDLARSALVGYPILGLAYLLDILGSVAEGFFFVGFSILVLTQLHERADAHRARRAERR